MRRLFSSPGIIVAEDRGTIYCRSPVRPKKRGAAVYSSMLRQIKRDFANCTQQLCGLR